MIEMFNISIVLLKFSCLEKYDQELIVKRACKYTVAHAAGVFSIIHSYGFISHTEGLIGLSMR